MYKTRVIGYHASMIQRARLIEETANEMDQDGYDLVGVTSTGSGAVLVFRKRREEERRG